MPNENSLPQALTIKQFCQNYGVSRSFVYAQISNGKLRTRKAGRRTLILRSDADMWLDMLPLGHKAAAVSVRLRK